MRDYDSPSALAEDRFMSLCSKFANTAHPLMAQDADQRNEKMESSLSAGDLKLIWCMLGLLGRQVMYQYASVLPGENTVDIMYQRYLKLSPKVADLAVRLLSLERHEMRVAELLPYQILTAEYRDMAYDKGLLNLGRLIDRGMLHKKTRPWKNTVVTLEPSFAF
ncbi:MAG TPA: hypothetical protein VIN59_03430 [Alphaproteobacteria bacterium]